MTAQRTNPPWPVTSVELLVVQVRHGRVALLDVRVAGTVLAVLPPGHALWLAERLREEAHRAGHSRGHGDAGQGEAGVD